MQESVSGLFGHQHSIKKYTPSNEFVLPLCSVGVEVELERMNNYAMTCPLINTIHEGSLRNGGLEYVFREPLFGVDVITALTAIEEELTPRKPTIDENCSLHVHIDARDMTGEHIAKLVLLYLVYEQPLYNYAAPEREDNIFCLSVNRAQSVIPTLGNIIRSIKNDDRFGVIHGVQEFPRYSGLNLQALQRFGSVEFRLHRATYNKEDIMRWINILMCLKKAAMDDSFDVCPYLTIKSLGINHATSVIFGDYAEYVKGNSEKDFVKMVDVGMRLARRVNNHNLLTNALRDMVIPPTEGSESTDDNASTEEVSTSSLRDVDALWPSLGNTSRVTNYIEGRNTNRNVPTPTRRIHNVRTGRNS